MTEHALDIFNLIYAQRAEAWKFIGAILTGPYPDNPGDINNMFGPIIEGPTLIPELPYEQTGAPYWQTRIFPSYIVARSYSFTNPVITFPGDVTLQFKQTGTNNFPGVAPPVNIPFMY